jgi:GPH family glycoside/pentoside/hexuronide:cation symporter
VAVLCFIVCFFLTKERENPADKGTRQSIFGDFITMLGNDQWRLIALFTFFMLTGVALRGGATPYYVTYYLGMESKISLFLTAGMLAGVAGALFANWMSKKICKVRMMRMATVAIVVTNIALALVPASAWQLALAVVILANFVHMVVVPYMFSTVADTVDYGLQRWKKGAMAMAYSGHLLALKIGIAVGGAATGWILAAVGYQANVDQSPEALQGILFAFAWSPAIAGVLMLGCLHFYRLDRRWANRQLAETT